MYVYLFFHNNEYRWKFHSVYSIITKNQTSKIIDLTDHISRVRKQSRQMAWFEAEKNRSFKLIPRNSILIQRVKIRYIKRKNENSSMHSFFLIFSRIRVVTETRDIMYSKGDNGHALNIKIVDLKRREFSCDSTHWPVKIDNCLAVM